jgi:predicted molibdopterin-dependent oxidoreductase YjgC
MDDRLVPSLCSYCGTGCGVLHQVVGGALTATWPDRSYPVNQGALCIKGWNLHEYAVSPKRLTTPLIRGESGQVPADWDTALGLAATRLKEIIAAHGPDAVAMLASAKASNEENYLFQKFMRAVVGSNNIDHCARL